MLLAGSPSFYIWLSKLFRWWHRVPNLGDDKDDDDSAACSKVSHVKHGFGCVGLILYLIFRICLMMMLTHETGYLSDDKTRDDKDDDDSSACSRVSRVKHGFGCVGQLSFHFLLQTLLPTISPAQNLLLSLRQRFSFALSLIQLSKPSFSR